MSTRHLSRTNPFIQLATRPLAVVLLVCISMLPACKKTTPSDYDIYTNMGDYMAGKLAAAGATARTDMPDKFKPGVTYIKKLTGLIRLVFGSSQLQVHLRSYDSPRMAVASISQFEVPPASGTYTDCAFVVRPAANIAAPFMHGDKRAPMAGSSDELSMDFYAYDKPDAADKEAYVDAFFGAETAKLNQAMDLVKDYQKVAPDRGKYTPYLEPYKSKYRLELALPKGADEAGREAYFTAVLQAFELYQDAYFAALAAAQIDTDQTAINARKASQGAFIDLLVENDAAYSLGKMLFGDDIALYFNQGFWREGVYGVD